MMPLTWFGHLSTWALILGTWFGLGVVFVVLFGALAKIGSGKR